MKTRCKCCNLPENIQNVVNTSLIKKVSYREIAASVNPMLKDAEKLTINNLSDHRNHIIEKHLDPDTGLTVSDSEFLMKMKTQLKQMTLNQCEVVLSAQNGDDLRAKRSLNSTTEILRKLWTMTTQCIGQIPTEPMDTFSIKNYLEDVK